jgi:hypothetical protein
MGEIELYDLGLDYPSHPDIIRSLTREQVMTARRWIDTQRLVTAIAGPPRPCSDDRLRFDWNGRRARRTRLQVYDWRPRGPLIHVPDPVSSSRGWSPTSPPRCADLPVPSVQLRRRRLPGPHVRPAGVIEQFRVLHRLGW